MQTEEALLILHRCLARVCPIRDWLALLSTCRFLAFSHARTDAIRLAAFVIPSSTSVGHVAERVARIAPFIRTVHLPLFDEDIDGLSDFEGEFDGEDDEGSFRHRESFAVANVSSILQLFTNLFHVDIPAMPSLSPTGHLKELESLRVSGQSVYESKIWELGTLHELPKLIHLKIRFASIESNQLAGLHNLLSLDLSGTDIESVRDLTSLVNLERLWLNNTNIQNISDLAELLNLQLVHLVGLHLDNWDSIFELPKLQDINLSKSGLDSVSKITSLPCLKNLDISWTPVNDIVNVSFASQLERLSLSLLPIDNIEAISNLFSLVDLDVSFAQIESIYPIQNLVNLRRVNFSGTLVQDLLPLRRLTSLRHLYLYETPVYDISSISKLTKLKSLGLSGSGVQNIGVVSALHRLSDIGISNTKVSDIAPLLSIGSLENVFVIGVDLSPAVTRELEKRSIKIWNQRFASSECTTNDREMSKFELRRQRYGM
ncbi:hypothetical protein HDU84_006999 [Entophlyctis sp. JEL0112]|nr:hypothetical protein HDU84_006999 [Entophlyctis sp. JEL0112]